MKTLRLLFGLSAVVDRKTYAIAGVLLMALKIAIDNAVAYAFTGSPFQVTAYLLPSLALKTQGPSGPTPAAMLVTLVVIALPFLWIGVSMSVRRAADAGFSPFFGLLFIVPILNYIAMLLLAVAPPASNCRWQPPTRGGAYRAAAPSPETPPDSLPRREMPASLRATLFGMLSSVTVGVGMIGVSIYSMQLYGAALFFGTPFAMGVITSFAYNLRSRRSLATSIGLALLSIVITGCVVLLFAVEGILCLLMAFPIAAMLATLGAIVGWAVAQQTAARPGHAVMSVLLLPGYATAEHAAATPQVHEVTTSIEIDAPPERVWPNVVGFSELPPPPELYFRLGIAYPMRARIQGEGPGAIRRCEFSTGPFVEPVTAWEPPRRLSFDVAAQPPSMTEWSPWKNIQAAHVEGYMVSRRGEFRLVPLADERSSSSASGTSKEPRSGGRTRLEGSTWYTLSIFPEAYWTVWGEALLHSIHGRVLSHIKRLTER